MPKLIEIRKLAAVDMAWLGPRVVLAEYAMGIILPLALGLFTLRSTQTLLGVWLVTIAVNYVPLFLYAVSIARLGSVETEGRPEIKHARRYGVQQVIILVPCLVALIAAMQEIQRRRRK